MEKLMKIISKILIGLFVLSVTVAIVGVILFIWNIQPEAMYKVAWTAFCSAFLLGLSLMVYLIWEDL